MADSDSPVPPVSDELYRRFEIAYSRAEVRGEDWPERICAGLAAVLAATPAAEPRWQDLDPSLWQRMNEADPAIRQALIDAWVVRDIAAAGGPRYYRCDGCPEGTPVDRTRELADGKALVDFDTEGHVVGVEIL